MSSLLKVLLVASTLAGLLVACSSSDSDPGSASKAAPTCDGDTRKDIYVSGLSKQAATLSVRIVDALPAPPSKGTNTMTLEVVDAAGNPVDGATVAVTPFMPDHGHGSAVTPIVTAAGKGKYNVSKVYLSMAGLWRLTVTVVPAGSTANDVAFSFCLDG